MYLCIRENIKIFCELLNDTKNMETFRKDVENFQKSTKAYQTYFY